VTSPSPRTQGGKPILEDIDWLDVRPISPSSTQTKPTYTDIQSNGKLISTGKVKAIGISNFSKAEIELLL